MKRPETKKKLDEIERDERWTIIIGLVAVVLLGLLFEFIGFFPRADLGEVAATVKWSQIKVAENGIPPWSHFRAELENGKQVGVDSSVTPPPVPGERVVLHVRRNIIGYRTYYWLVGKAPALTPTPGSL